MLPPAVPQWIVLWTWEAAWIKRRLATRQGGIPSEDGSVRYRYGDGRSQDGHGAKEWGNAAGLRSDLEISGRLA